MNLPPWARNDPRLFVLVHRQALESDQVSQMLCQWIDLVFGLKQKGKAAVNAINVFHPAVRWLAVVPPPSHPSHPTRACAIATPMRCDVVLVRLL